MNLFSIKKFAPFQNLQNRHEIIIRHGSRQHQHSFESHSIIKLFTTLVYLFFLRREPLVFCRVSISPGHRTPLSWRPFAEIGLHSFFRCGYFMQLSTLTLTTLQRSTRCRSMQRPLTTWRFCVNPMIVIVSQNTLFASVPALWGGQDQKSGRGGCRRSQCQERLKIFTRVYSFLPNNNLHTQNTRTSTQH